jgi:hypothetical protein
MSRKIVVALTFALLAALMLSSVASAVTIVVDGVREAAWDGSGGQTPGTILDPNEGAITDGYDIQRVQWTNDPTKLYLLIQTYANTIFTGNPMPTIFICLDTDNNSGTGGTYANCNGMTGIDRTILINRSTVEVYNGDPNTGTVIGNGIRATATNITEVSVNLSDLGLSSAFCPSSITTAIYFDNGIVDPDDNVPDSGTATISCGAPTAVTLNSLQAQPTTSPVLPLALVGGAAVILTGTVLFIRRKRIA